MFRIFPTIVVDCIVSIGKHAVFELMKHSYTLFGLGAYITAFPTMYRHTRKGHLGGVGDLKEAVFNSTKVLAACIQRGSPHLLQSLSQSVETINFTLSFKFLTSSVLFLCC